jgi:hypothetical protein
VNAHVFLHSLRAARATVVALGFGAAVFFYIVLLASSAFVADAGRQRPSWPSRRVRSRRSWADPPTSFIRPAG